MIEKILQQTDILIKQNISQYKTQFEKDINAFREDLKKEYIYNKANIQKMIDEILIIFEKELEGKLKQCFDKRNEEILKEISTINQKIILLEEKINKIKINNEKEKNDLILDYKTLIEKNTKEQKDTINILEEKIPNLFENYINKNIKIIKKKILSSIFK